MRLLIKTSILTVALLLTMMLGEAGHESSPASEQQGEFTEHQAPMLPVADDYGPLFTAPIQAPVLVPNQSSRLVFPAEYRSSLSRTNNLRRSFNRLSINIYTPIAHSGRLIIERMSSPLRCAPATRFYVFELCRLLC